MRCFQLFIANYLQQLAQYRHQLNMSQPTEEQLEGLQGDLQDRMIRGGEWSR